MNLFRKPGRVAPRRQLATMVLIALLAGGLISSGCVYYNTFYNARKAFNQAEKTRTATVGRRGRVDTKQYQIAIEKSLKVIEEHPNSSWYDDALYVLAVSYFYTDQQIKAERRFRELLANHPDSKFRQDAQLYLGKSKLNQNDVDDAMELFEEIFVGNFGKKLKSEAALALGQYHYDNQDYTQANLYLRAIRDSLGTGRESKLSQTMIADGAYEAFKFREALGGYMQLLGMDPTTPERYHALFRAARCSYQLQDIAPGLDYLKTLMDDQLYFDSLGVLKLEVAWGYELDDDLAQAEVIYDEVATGSQDNRAVAEAYYNLGLIYQYDYDDLTQAKEYYDKTVEFGRSLPSGKDALQRSSDIGKLEIFKRTVAIDSTTSQENIDEAAHTQFQLSELYWFQLNKPDTAILEMQYIVDSFPTAFMAPKAMIALSAMIRERRGDSVLADSILREVLIRYPGSDYKDEALEVLQVGSTGFDSAYAASFIRRAEYFVVDDLNVDSARANYQYVVDNFPDSKHYLRARFALLWLTEEYQSPGDSSVIFAYQDFADSFPGTPWASIARQRSSYSSRPSTSLTARERFLADTASDSSVIADADGQDQSVLDTASEYLDPLEALYVGPNGEEAIDFPSNVKILRTRELFIYPTEAYRTGWEGVIHFQVFLDFTGEVTELIQKTFSPSEEIDLEATETVESMTFDIQRIPSQYLGSWFVYQFNVRLPDHLR